jgi:hypothetical protein
MVQTQQIISKTILDIISLAEHPNTEPNIASVARTKLFERLRKEGVSLRDAITRAPATSSGIDAIFRKIAEDHVNSLLRKLDESNRVKTNHWGRICELRNQLAAMKDPKKALKVIEAKNAKIEKLEARIEELETAEYELEIAIDESSEEEIEREFTDRVKSAMEAYNAEIAAINSKLEAVRLKAAADRAELETARAQSAADRAALAAERAKPAPISAADWATLEKKARDLQAENTTLKEALAKTKVSPAAAPAPNASASDPAAPASLAKGSQRALKASATRRAKAAPATPTTAPAPASAIPKPRKAPRTGSLRADVLELLLAMPGHQFSGDALAKFRLCLFPNNCKAKAAVHTDEWNTLPGQLRTEIHWLRDHLKADGVVAISKSYGRRRTWAYSVPGSVRPMSCHVQVGKDFCQQFRWLRDNSGFAPGSWRIDFDKVLGSVVRFENDNDRVIFKQAVR